MSSNFKSNCCGFVTGCCKLKFFSVGCHNPEKIGKHCSRYLFVMTKLVLCDGSITNMWSLNVFINDFTYPAGE